MTTKEKKQGKKSLRVLIKKILNEKPSEMLGHAMDALVKFEKKKNCKVDMKSWHGKKWIMANLKTGKNIKVCTACLGGIALMDRLEITDRKAINTLIKDVDVQFTNAGVDDVIKHLLKNYGKYNGSTDSYHAIRILSTYEHILDGFRRGDVSGAFMQINNLRASARMAKIIKDEVPQYASLDYASINDVKGKQFNTLMPDYGDIKDDPIANKLFKQATKRLIGTLKSAGV